MISLYFSFSSGFSLSILFWAPELFRTVNFFYSFLHCPLITSSCSFSILFVLSRVSSEGASSSSKLALVTINNTQKKYLYWSSIPSIGPQFPSETEPRNLDQI
jgi:hypothetical protein